MCAGDAEHKPISIIITTLAAHAYNEEPTISSALQSILTGMDRYIDDRDGTAWVANPVNPAENFADKWVEVPKKRQNFYRWLDQARQDFALYLRASSFDKVPEQLRKHLGATLVDSTVSALIPAATVALATPAVASGVSGHDEARRAERAVESINRTGPQSKPWVRS